MNEVYTVLGSKSFFTALNKRCNLSHLNIIWNILTAYVYNISLKQKTGCDNEPGWWWCSDYNDDFLSDLGQMPPI